MRKKLGNSLALSGVGLGETNGTWMSFVEKGRGITSH
jgi:hypothetical protein